MTQLHFPNSIIIKPVGSFCNLNCDYCFYLSKNNLYEGDSSRHRMSANILEKIIKEMFIHSNEPSFIWHGGEPTLMGFDFLTQIISFQKKYSNGKKYHNSIQTNGFFLSTTWMDFLKNENFLVGVSLDGPEHVHDYYRKTKKGRSTFEKVYKNVKILQKKGVLFNILATVNNYSVNYPKEIYNFFVDNEFYYMQFSPVLEQDPNNINKAANFSVDSNDYGVFLYELFKLWINDFDFSHLKQKTSIRFFDNIMQLYIGIIPDHCMLHKNCNQYLVIEHNGDFYSCDYLVSNETKIGNINNISIFQAFNSKSHIEFGNQKSNINEKCKKCMWLKLCYGGCIKDRIKDKRDNGHNHFCNSNKYFFSRTHEQFKKLAYLYNKYYKN